MGPEQVEFMYSGEILVLTGQTKQLKGSGSGKMLSLKAKVPAASESRRCSVVDPEGRQQKTSQTHLFSCIDR